MRVALDTNVLAYAAGVNGEARRDEALKLIGRLPEPDTFISLQALSELFRVLVGKAKRSPAQARTTVLRWHDTFPATETSASILRAAVDLAVDHDLNVWDAIILAAAAEAGCRLLLSEDLQDGFTWNGVTVANPFAAKRNELLKRALEP